MKKEGSSPLARGLPLDLDPEARDTGIIPARAGFTQGLDRLEASTGDHPRSRGVYPPPAPPRGAPAWIIPARAGFTRRPPPAARPPRDHPRSRGVYVCALWRRSGVGGSSPLARGLPLWELDPEFGRGIIPARAGFTLRIRGRRGARRDHPRSRGVYGVSRITVSRWEGSSPLARGLHWAARVVAEAAGIIPARAGFTQSGEGNEISGEDHPRSRGVYKPAQVVRAGFPGSSPLARGLRSPGGQT